MSDIDKSAVNWMAVLANAGKRAREYELEHADAYAAYEKAPTEENKVAWWKAHDRLVQAYNECKHALEKLRRSR